MLLRRSALPQHFWMLGHVCWSMQGFHQHKLQPRQQPHAIQSGQHQWWQGSTAPHPEPAHPLEWQAVSQAQVQAFPAMLQGGVSLVMQDPQADSYLAPGFDAALLLLWALPYSSWLPKMRSKSVSSWCLAGPTGPSVTRVRLCLLQPRRKVMPHQAAASSMQGGCGVRPATVVCKQAADAGQAPARRPE